MIKKFFSTGLAVGLFSATVAVQAATLTFTHESTGYLFENVTNTWTGSFEVNYAFDNSGVTLSTNSGQFGFDPFLVVWDSQGAFVAFDNRLWDAYIDLGTTLANGTYYFTIGNWPNNLINGNATTVDFSNVGASFATPPGTNLNVLYPIGLGNGHWNVTVTGVVPEPETWAMLLAGLAIVGSVARRRKLMH
jgi:hypothetical protein